MSPAPGTRGSPLWTGLAQRAHITVRRKLINIACPGRGTVIWNRKGLPIRRSWCEDGPLVPVALARQSEGERIALAIVPVARPVRLLSALMDSDNLEEAGEQARQRETTAERHLHRRSRANRSRACMPELGAWTLAGTIDAVIRTGLSPKFTRQDHRLPSVEETLDSLGNLPGTAREGAEGYVRPAPRQIGTGYRRRIEPQLRWLPRE